MINGHRLFDIVFATGGACSALHTLLPPWDWNPVFVEEGLADFPKLQDRCRRVINFLFHNRYYKLLIYVLGTLAFALRSTFWKSAISMPVQFAKKQANGG